ncbi:MAG: DUF1801 domain-containing protein [Bacteroidetes bacterium]|nr:MAG: DUF1801 domain-containing protein [Bacteroidota bacterium]MBL1144571.1 DUF1801 domain-containing protein [Bacteroidota bacterium]NOG57366.1 DUF1801 domain-containing protein [Bacteroidota bacterium]
MAANKTQATTASVTDFIETVEHEQKKKDAYVLLELMTSITNEKGVLWGTNLIGFGNYHYKYESGREGDFFKVGFSPRKTAISIYIIPGFERYDELMQQLGKFKTGASCLYVNKLSDIDLTILKQLIEQSFAYMTAKHKS